MKSGERYVEGVRFSVQDYKKPEYAVKVTRADAARAAGPADQGDHRRQVLLRRSRWRTPKSNGWCTRRTYWPFGRYESDAEGEGYADEAEGPGEDDMYGGEQESEQSGTLDADGKLQITIPTKANTKKARCHLSHRSARHRCGQSRNFGPRLRAGNLWQLLSHGTADIVRVHQGKYRRPSTSPRRTTTRSRLPPHSARN